MMWGPRVSDHHILDLEGQVSQGDTCLVGISYICEDLRVGIDSRLL
jgi:hypothetical protein